MPLNAIHGGTLQTLKIEELTTQPIFRDNIMYYGSVTNIKIKIGTQMTKILTE